ncbi:hypothetical protein [Rhodoblastus acidophilus]|uniref:hypothetical protein n=1 Tax=Rhodoblastus acidophilus TaxID=1074 RepID=UPI003CD01E49
MRPRFPPASSSTSSASGSVFASVDKNMQTENDYDREVFNGDLGRVVRIDREEGALVSSFDGREVTYSFGWTRSFPPTRPRSTSRRGPNMPPS